MPGENSTFFTSKAGRRSLEKSARDSIVICGGHSMAIRVHPRSLAADVQGSAKGELRWGR
jgi:hypothetical protein